MFRHPNVTSYNRAGAVLGMYAMSAGTVPDCVGGAVRQTCTVVRVDKPVKAVLE
jgi:hypothetical protein